MDHPTFNAINDAVEHTSKGPVSLSVSIISAILAFITLKDAQVLVSIVAGIIATGSGVMAMRYYWHATKKIKNQ